MHHLFLLMHPLFTTYCSHLASLHVTHTISSCTGRGGGGGGVVLLGGEITADPPCRKQPAKTTVPARIKQKGRADPLLR